MQPKIISKEKLRIYIIFVFLLFLGAISYFIFKNPVESNSVALITNANNSTGKETIENLLPVRINIPSIKINALIEEVGLTPEGAMDSPKGPSNVGWYNLGPKPGESGSAVVDGHSGWKDNIPAVFDNLYKIQTGDKIYIESKTGTITTFVVREIKSYDPKASARDVFISKD